ncbi:helix-turn-helix domain-containing protein [Paenibacillus chartarius]|uniref:Helix-turn-helix domain-containing protein n=1 Tax=Paenibacillus chartarius TaxID=747481 RepID=A0ABV6DR87_9BACL
MNPGDRIRNLRLWKRMTQGELVEGISSVAYLSKIENNLASPSSRFLHEVAGRLGVQPEDLLQPASVRFEDEIRGIFLAYWERDLITGDDISKLSLHLLEVHSNETYLMMYAVLIRYHYLNSTYKAGLELYAASLKYVKENDTETPEFVLFYYYQACGLLFFNLQDFVKSNQYLLRSETFAKDRSHKDKARLYFNLSLVHQRLQYDVGLCLYYSEKACFHIKQLNDPNRTANLVLTRGIQFLLAKRPEEAMQCVEEARELVREDGNEELLAAIDYNFGRAHQLAGEYEQAVAFMYRSLDRFAKLPDSTKVQQNYRRLIEVYLQLRDWQKAAECLQIAERYAEQNKEVLFDIELHLLRAQLYRYTEDTRKYEKELHRLLDYCVKMNQHHQVKSIGKQLGDYYYERKSYRKAAECYHVMSRNM